MSLFPTFSGDVGILASSVMFRPVLITFENHNLGNGRLKTLFLTWCPQLRSLLLTLGPAWEED